MGLSKKKKTEMKRTQCVRKSKFTVQDTANEQVKEVDSFLTTQNKNLVHQVFVEKTIQRAIVFAQLFLTLLELGKNF